MSNLSLDTLMALAQAASARRAAQDQQAQRAQQQAQQQSQQTQGAQAGQGAPGACQPASANPVQPTVDAAAAGARNQQAGEEWAEFQAAPTTQSEGAPAPEQTGEVDRDAFYQRLSAEGAPVVDAADAADAATTAPVADDAAPAATALRTNQDLINHAYATGDGTWAGASQVARQHGTTMSALVKDRGGLRPGVSASSTSSTSSTSSSSSVATGVDAPATPTTEAAPRAQGVDRPIKGFREVDTAKLQGQLPAQAKHLAQAFVDSGRRHNVDPLALAAISKHETGNFTSSAFRNKNNAMGVSDSRGPVHQASHEASIEKMARLLGNTRSGPYKNATTIGETANIYAPVGAGNDPRGLNNHWAKGVAKFADDFERKVGAPRASGGAQTTGGVQASGGVDVTNTPRGADGVARIERTTKAGQRDQMVAGSITVNGHTYQFRSGGHGRGSLPRGEYQVTRHLDARSDRAMSVDGVGYSFAVSDKYDPRVGDTRSLLRIHPDGGSAGTQGCIGIVGDAATQRQFRADMLAEIRRNGGSYTLQVQ